MMGLDDGKQGLDCKCVIYPSNMSEFSSVVKRPFLGGRAGRRVKEESIDLDTARLDLQFQ